MAIIPSLAGGVGTDEVALAQGGSSILVTGAHAGSKNEKTPPAVLKP